MISFASGVTRSPGFFSAFLECVDVHQFPKDECYVECSMSLLNARDSERSTFNKFMAVYHSRCTDQGFGQVAKLTELTADSGFVENDSLHLLVKIDVPNPNRFAKW